MPEAKTPSPVTSEVIGVACAERGQSVGQKRRILHRVASNLDCPFPGLSRLLKRVGGPEEAACDLESRRCAMLSCDGCGRIVRTMQNTHVALAIHLKAQAVEAPPSKDLRSFPWLVDALPSGTRKATNRIPRAPASASCSSSCETAGPRSSRAQRVGFKRLLGAHGGF